MANTYTQIYLHVVFAVSGRACVIASARREELQKYITGIVTRRGQKLIAIYCMSDHTLAARPETQHCSVRSDRRYQNGIDQSHQRTKVDRMPVFVAARLRCVFRFAFYENHSNKSTLRFWSDITFRSISVMFSSQSNEFESETCRSYGAFPKERQ